MKLATVWVVFDARPTSQLVDVFAKCTIDELRRVYLGGPPPIGVYTTEVEALLAARAELDRAGAPRGRSLEERLAGLVLDIRRDEREPDEVNTLRLRIANAVDRNATSQELDALLSAFDHLRQVQQWIEGMDLRTLERECPGVEADTVEEMRRRALEARTADLLLELERTLDQLRRAGLAPRLGQR